MQIFSARRALTIFSQTLPAIGLLFLGLAATVGGCAGRSPSLTVKDSQSTYAAETIVDMETGMPTGFDSLIHNLSRTDVVFLGEQHTDKRHHEIQLQILKALWEKDPSITVGMEMFSREYQPVLDLWSDGQLEQSTFLEKVQWYANWRFPYHHYSEILAFVRDKHIPVVALNLPAHIPARIATGGMDNLLAGDRRKLPADIDLTNEPHREYVRDIFEKHHIPGRSNFEYFYQAQCVWEDIMAQSISENLNGRRMVVLLGNGHIVHKFGVPQRTFKRTNRPFATIYPASVGTVVEKSVADYVWVTPPRREHPQRHP